VGYQRRAGPRYVPGPYIDRSHIFAAGSMYSSVEDLYRWNQALTHSNLFSEELRRKIFTPELGDWSYGWFVRRIAAGQPGEGSIMAEMRRDMPGNFFAWFYAIPNRAMSSSFSEMDTGLPRISSVISKRFYLTANRACLEEARWILPRRSVGCL
jgi:CubicO group peptidase (beta-lactamase class C family)